LPGPANLQPFPSLPWDAPAHRVERRSIPNEPAEDVSCGRDPLSGNGGARIAIVGPVDFTHGIRVTVAERGIVVREHNIPSLNTGRGVLLRRHDGRIEVDANDGPGVRGVDPVTRQRKDFPNRLACLWRLTLEQQRPNSDAFLQEDDLDLLSHSSPYLGLVQITSLSGLRPLALQ